VGLLIMSVHTHYKADPDGRKVHDVGLRPLVCCGRGFESRSWHGCLSVVFICCVVLCR
jgi:hypothetical protein